MEANLSNERENFPVASNVLVIIHLELYVSLKEDLAI